jgi:hypothetical protein
MNESSVEEQISGCLHQYTPEIEARLRECRAKLRSLFPRGYELVYDNYNALVFGIAPTERASDALISVAGYPRWVTLFFLRGADLDDPEGLLEGTGRLVRSLRLERAADLDRPAVRALIRQAASARDADFAGAPPLQTLLKSVSAKRRPRRPAAQPTPSRPRSRSRSRSRR